MPFILPDLVVESILRDGFENARRDPTVIDDVFGNLTRAYSSAKYGDKEINKIKKMVQKKEVNLIHAFNLAEMEAPTISIQLINDTEDTGNTYLGDQTGFQEIQFSDPQQLASLVQVPSFETTAYDPKTGIVSVPDTVNLANVYANLLFVDNAGVEFPIVGGIDNTPGQKKFAVAKQSEVTIGTGSEIKSSINFDRIRIKGVWESTQILLGIHTKDALLTKYMYVLVKYFLLSRKDDLCARDIQLSTYSGSDFTRNMEYKADLVYSRFITLSGKLQHDWRDDKVQLIDNVQVQTLVEADEYGNKTLDLEDQTVKTTKE